MENKGKLILTEIFPSMQKHDIFSINIDKTSKNGREVHFTFVDMEKAYDTASLRTLKDMEI